MSQKHRVEVNASTLHYWPLSPPANSKAPHQWGDELNEENVQIFLQECLKLRLPFEDIMSTYFSTKHSIKSLCVEEAFCYKHRTEQEFAAGSAICDMLVNEHGLYDLIHEDSENISCCFTHVLP